MNYKNVIFFLFVVLIFSCKEENVHRQLNTDVYEDSVYTLYDYQLRGAVKEVKEYEKDTTKPSTYTFDEFGNLKNYWMYDEGRKLLVYENKIENGKVVKFSYKSMVNRFTNSYPVTEFEYDENLNLIKTSSLTSKNPADAWVEYKYNKDNILIESKYTRESKSYGTQKSTSRFEYDEKGRSSRKIEEHRGMVAKVNTLHYLDDGIVVDSVSSSVGGVTRGFVKYIYDGENLMSVTDNYYEGNEVETLRTKKFTYNDKGDVLKETEDFANKDTKDRRVEYEYLEYDSEGNWLVRETNERGKSKKIQRRKIEYYTKKYLF